MNTNELLHLTLVLFAPTQQDFFCCFFFIFQIRYFFFVFSRYTEDSRYSRYVSLWAAQKNKREKETRKNLQHTYYDFIVLSLLPLPFQKKLVILPDEQNLIPLFYVSTIQFSFIHKIHYRKIECLAKAPFHFFSSTPDPMWVKKNRVKSSSQNSRDGIDVDRRYVEENQSNYYVTDFRCLFLAYQNIDEQTLDHFSYQKCIARAELFEPYLSVFFS